MIYDHNLRKRIWDQKLRMEEDSKKWKKLQALANDNDVTGFYTEYVKYLNWSNIISDRRRILAKMAVLAARELKNENLTRSAD